MMTGKKGRRAIRANPRGPRGVRTDLRASVVSPSSLVFTPPTSVGACTSWNAASFLEAGSLIAQRCVFIFPLVPHVPSLSPSPSPHPNTLPLFTSFHSCHTQLCPWFIPAGTIHVSKVHASLVIERIAEWVYCLIKARPGRFPCMLW